MRESIRQPTTRSPNKYIQTLHELEQGTPLSEFLTKERVAAYYIAYDLRMQKLAQTRPDRVMEHAPNQDIWTRSDLKGLLLNGKDPMARANAAIVLGYQHATDSLPLLRRVVDADVSDIVVAAAQEAIDRMIE